MTAIRWWLFKQISAFGWWVCPEPHRGDLQYVMPQWKDIPEAPNWEERERRGH